MKPLDINEYDCTQCGENVPTNWSDCGTLGSCGHCDGLIVDAGRETTLRRQRDRLRAENERLKNLCELHRQAVEKDVSAHDRAEIQAFYDNIASKEPSLAHQANTVQANAIARLNAEVEQLRSQLKISRDLECKCWGQP